LEEKHTKKKRRGKEGARYIREGVFLMERGKRGGAGQPSKSRKSNKRT